MENLYLFIINIYFFVNLASGKIDERFRHFCSLFVDSKFRLCSMVVKYVRPEPTSQFELYTIELIKNNRADESNDDSDDDTDDNDNCLKGDLQLQAGIISVKTPLLPCGLRAYPEGAQYPPIVFYIIPDLERQSSVFLVEQRGVNKYKLTKHIRMLPIT